MTRLEHDEMEFEVVELLGMTGYERIFSAARMTYTTAGTLMFEDGERKLMVRLHRIDEEIVAISIWDKKTMIMEFVINSEFAGSGSDWSYNGFPPVDIRTGGCSECVDQWKNDLGGMIWDGFRWVCSDCCEDEDPTN